MHFKTLLNTRQWINMTWNAEFWCLKRTENTCSIFLLADVLLYSYMPKVWWFTQEMPDIWCPATLKMNNEANTPLVYSLSVYTKSRKNSPPKVFLLKQIDVIKYNFWWQIVNFSYGLSCYLLASQKTSNQKFLNDANSPTRSWAKI